MFYKKNRYTFIPLELINLYGHVTKFVYDKVSDWLAHVRSLIEQTSLS